ncbi:2-octaprenyl-6-methoxyphenyl hydroxylase [Gilvimarinus polysaccharolyticus]|uniref:2-octaprenyl-6-methoxyphenyl hydroxylase n=1 Tax=Gilvimarinus polysaccharolyticus TaxID=863921 RepID=UPI0006731A3A|nr:2-octaprenyl-6-methoxyphenyl hydroxylase [Gilvimarinus polysaccharolyticus]
MNHSECSYDLAIVGAGPAGACLALLCAQARPDWRIAIVDPQPNVPDSGPYHPSFDARATALSAGSVNLFTQLQLWQLLARHATAINAVHVSDRGYLPGQLLDASSTGNATQGYVIANTWLGRVLLQALNNHNNITLHQADVTGLTPTANGYQLTLQQQTTPLSARLTAVADGAHSPLRQSLGITTHDTPYHQSAIIANVKTSKPHLGVAYERFLSSGPLALLPLGQSPQAREMALVWTQPTDASHTLLALSEQDFLAALQQHFGHRLGRFQALSPRHSYPLVLRQAREQVRRNLVLVGNSAHFLHPVAGQGFNLALRDCAALASIITNSDNPGELALLQRYLAERERDQALTTRAGDTMVRLFSSSALPAIALRHLGLLSLELAPALRSAFGRHMMGVSRAQESYRGQ